MKSLMKVNIVNTSVFFMLAFALSFNSAYAKDKKPKRTSKSIDAEIQAIKQEVISINEEMLNLQEDLLFPGDTQVAIYFSIDVGKFLTPDSVRIKLDDKVVANYLYTKREINALERGGVHRVYIGNMRMGEHELVAFVIGKNHHGKSIKLAVNESFVKGQEPKYIELKLVDNSKNKRADFKAAVWD